MTDHAVQTGPRRASPAIPSGTQRPATDPSPLAADIPAIQPLDAPLAQLPLAELDDQGLPPVPPAAEREEAATFVQTHEDHDVRELSLQSFAQLANGTMDVDLTTVQGHTAPPLAPASLAPAPLAAVPLTAPRSATVTPPRPSEFATRKHDDRSDSSNTDSKADDDPDASSGWKQPDAPQPSSANQWKARP